LGILLSVPFVPPLDAEIRTYAAGIPWFIGLIMIGCDALFRLIPTRTARLIETEKNPGNSYGLWFSGSIILILLVIGPLLMHFLIKTDKKILDNRCESGSSYIVTTIHRGNYVNIVPDDSMRVSFLPNLRNNDFQHSIHNSPIFHPGYGEFPVSTGDSFFQAFDWIRNKFVYVVGKTELFDSNQGWVELCGTQEIGSNEYGFFHAESARLLTDQVSNELR